MVNICSKLQSCYLCTACSHEAILASVFIQDFDIAVNEQSIYNENYMQLELLQLNVCAASLFWNGCNKSGYVGIDRNLKGCVQIKIETDTAHILLWLWTTKSWSWIWEYVCVGACFKLAAMKVNAPPRVWYYMGIWENFKYISRRYKIYSIEYKIHISKDAFPGISRPSQCLGQIYFHNILSIFPWYKHIFL